MGRRNHAKKEVEQALQYAEENGWRVEERGSHAKNPEDHARALKRVVNNCVVHQLHKKWTNSN